MAESIQSLRLFQVVQQLTRSRTGVPLQELASEHGCNQKTIRRDLDLLRRVGFPLKETPGPHGRKAWTIDAAEQLPKLTFTLTEALSLYLGRRLLEPLAGTYVWDGAQSAFRKIRDCLTADALAYLKQLDSAFLQTALGTGDYTERGAILDALMIGIEDAAVTRIGYHSLQQKSPRQYDVHPYGLVYHKGSLYLIAFSTQHDELRHFKVDRIHSALATSTSKFERPADFNLARHLAGSFGVFQPTGPLQTVRIRFTKEAARHIQEHRWHPSQKLKRQKDGALTAEFQLADLHEVKSWVLSFGSTAKVESPPKLREEIEREIQKMCENYRTRA